MLQSLSCELIAERNIQALYEKIVDAAVTIMRSDYGSMQMLYPERGSGGELRLLAFRGFNPQAAKFWEWVRADSESTCGVALRMGERVIATDIANCEFMAGSEDQRTYLQTGIHACQTTPLVARGGKVVGMISTHWHTPHQPSEAQFCLLDILARQAADLIERTRHEEESVKQAGLLDLSSDAIIVRDMEGRILYWNAGAEQVYGWSRAEAVGKNIHSLLQTQFPEPPERISEEVHRTGRWGGELTHTTRDGRSITVLCRKVLTRSEHGSPPLILVTNSDITERKLIAEQLRKSERIAAAGQLAASLAHEINNPLSSVTNTLYLLGHLRLDAAAHELLNTAATELARIVRIVKQSLSYYRVNTAPREFNLTELVEESLELFSDRFQRAGVQLVKKITPAAPIVGFADEVRQVVDNLLLNAFEAMPNGGRIIVSVRWSRQWSKQQNAVCLTIADTGSGIPAQNREHIFEPFFTTKAEKGTGLGLWVARGIVTKHDGRIKLRSRNAGNKSGTVFSVLFPSNAQVQRRQRPGSESAA